MGKMGVVDRLSQHSVDGVVPERLPSDIAARFMIFVGSVASALRTRNLGREALTHADGTAIVRDGVCRVDGQPPGDIQPVGVDRIMMAW